MSKHRRKTDTLPTCMNCGAVLYGSYCSQCGQRSAKPITWRGVIRDSLRRVRSMDSRWLRTAAALTVDPGRMIRRYLRGRRDPYVAPPLYATFAVALCLVVVVWLRIELNAPGTPWWMPVTSSAISSTEIPEPRAAESAARREAPVVGRGLAQAVFALTAASSLLVAAVTAFVQSRLFQYHDFNWAETYVFELFVFGQLALHQTLFALLGAFSSTLGLVTLGIVIVLFLAFALSGFYRKGVLISLTAALLLATVQVAGVFVVGSLARIALRG